MLLFHNLKFPLSLTIYMEISFIISGQEEKNNEAVESGSIHIQ